MTCSYCGTELPQGAMFCGECGRPVASRTARNSEARLADAQPATLIEPPQAAPQPVTEADALVVIDLVEATPFVPEQSAGEQPAGDQSVPGGEPAPRETHSPGFVEPVDSVERCAQCGAPLSPTDIFCPECGFVRHRAAAPARASDTNVFDPFPWGLPRPADHAAPVAVPVDEPAVKPVDVPAPPTDLAAGPEPEAAPAAAAVVGDAGASRYDADTDIDIDETRIVDRTARGERFVLQFSTGESVSVTGTGLIGRNPIVEPGEYVDSLIAIIDPGKSVSKTHLEFGQEGGAFWISDRFSGNGTVVREPDRQPKRSDAGKRYRVVRGTRVEIGEQFFIVS